MKILMSLALAASLSACAPFAVRPPTEASIASALDRAVKAEGAYAAAAQVTVLTVRASDAERAAEIDRKIYAALVVVRARYPRPESLADSDRARLAAATARSDASHAALQDALAAPD